jgi:hypothetical protein
MQYKSIFPDTNSPNGYSSNDLLTFIIPIDADQEVEQGSIYVSGTLHVEKTGPAPLLATDNVQYDAQAGIHGFIRGVVVSVDAGAGDMIIENNPTYSRYAKMFYEANQHYITQVVQNSASMELRCGQDSYTPYVLTGIRNDANNANIGDNSFSFLPLVSVNRTTGNLGGDKIRKIKIQFTLDSVSSIFTNPNAVAGLDFRWLDVKCHYNTQPLQPSQAPLQFFKIINTKTVINSSDVNLTYQPPANVLSVSCTFNKKGNTKLLMTDQLPNVTRVEFAVSGADYTLKFPLKSEEEIVLNYIKSLNSNMMESNAIYANLLGSGYGIGLNYLNPINFLQSRMSINIQSALTANEQYTMYTYFTCIDAF